MPPPPPPPSTELDEFEVSEDNVGIEGVPEDEPPLEPLEEGQERRPRYERLLPLDPLEEGHEGVLLPEAFDDGVEARPWRGKVFTSSSKLNLRLSDDRTLSGLLGGAWFISMACGVSPVVAPI